MRTDATLCGSCIYVLHPVGQFCCLVMQWGVCDQAAKATAVDETHVINAESLWLLDRV